MSKVTFNKPKTYCRFYRSCIDFKRKKDVCSGDWIYCYTYNNLIRKEEKLRNKEYE